jgi:hypothetical protein
MRPDQQERLRSVAEALTDVFLEEADPGHWPGAGVPLAQHTQAQRGDRVWHKKTVAASLLLLINIERLTENSRAGHPGEDDDLDRQIADAEAQAIQLLDKLTQRTHGAP